MSPQSYANHVHHPVFTYVATGLWLLAFAAYQLRWGPRFETLGLLGATLCLISITRVYTTRLQDRIIRLEERLRAAALLTPTQLARFAELTPKQVAALRFAGDAELPALLDRTPAEGLTPTAIKKAIKDWRADLHRT